MDLLARLRDSDIPRQYQTGRMKVIDAVGGYAIGKLAENYFVFHVLMAGIVIAILGAHLRERRRLTIFFFHIACMTIGSFLLLANGIVAFRNTFLVDNLSPIMQHSKKLKVRVIHRTLNVVGAFFIFLGYLFIISDKIEEGESLMPESVHGYLGYVVLILIIVQSVSGLDKLEVFRQYNMKVKRWHNDVGTFTWDVICLTVVLGCLLLFEFSLFFLFLTGLIALGWLSFHLQIKKKMPEFEEDLAGAKTSGDAVELLSTYPEGGLGNFDDDDNDDGQNLRAS